MSQNSGFASVEAPPCHQIFEVRNTANKWKSVCETARVAKAMLNALLNENISSPLFLYSGRPRSVTEGIEWYARKIYLLSPTLHASPQANYEKTWALQLYKLFWLLLCNYAWVLCTIKGQKKHLQLWTCNSALFHSKCTKRSFRYCFSFDHHRFRMFSSYSNQE